MMWQEFENLAGYEVTYETYTNIIEPMYMALPESVSKADFIKMLDKKAFALPTKKEMVKEMKKLANGLFEICGHCSDWESEDKLEKLAKEYARRFHGIDWNNDLKSYVFFNRGYEYPTVQRGCTYPRELVIGRDGYDYERIVLVK